MDTDELIAWRHRLTNLEKKLPVTRYKGVGPGEMSCFTLRYAHYY